MPITRAERVNFGRLVTVEAEGSYNAGYTGTGGELIYLLEDPKPRIRYLFDGDRGRSWVSGGQLMPQGRSGVYVEVPIVTQSAGPVNTWSASVRPSLHRLLQGCGHTAVLDATPGSEKWTYTPPSQPLWNSDQSVAMRAQWHGVRQDIQGAFGTFRFEAGTLGIPTWTFDYTGLMASGTFDNVVDEVSSPLSVQPLGAAYPVAQGVTINIGDYLNARVRSFSFTQNREIVVRADQSLAYTGLCGISGGRRTPQWELLLEATPKIAGNTTAAGVNPWGMQAGSSFDLKYKCTSFGSFAPFRFEIPRAVLDPDGFEQEEDGPIVLWRLRGSCRLTGDGSSTDYDYRIVYPNA